MISGLKTVFAAVRHQKLVWLASTAGFVLIYYLFLLAMMVIRFDNLPNYVTFYDYIGNVFTILRETPDILDTLPIIRDEWLLEIGFMNYDYGHGISEWSLNIIPSYLILQCLAGMMVGAAIVLWIDLGAAKFSPKCQIRDASAVGGGAFLVGFTSATLSWVVCCASSTWVVSLAMLGLSASTALWLEPAGLILSMTGFALLIIGISNLTRERNRSRRTILQ